MSNGMMMDLNNVGDALAKAIDRKLQADVQYKKAAEEKDAASAERRKAEVLRAEAETLRLSVESRKAEIEREERAEARRFAERADERREEREERDRARAHQMALLTGAISALTSVVKAADKVSEEIAAASDVGGIRAAWEDVKKFAEAHPWLTAALVVIGVVAVGVVAYTAYDWFFGSDASTSVDGDTALRLAAGG